MRIRTLAGILAGLTIVAACGDDSSTAPSATAGRSTTAAVAATTTEPPSSVTTSPPVTTSPATTAPATAPAATAIVSLSPTATEMLYAIGAGDQVVAVDDFSNHPPATADKMHGINALEPNVESIAGFDPDLVITDGTNPDLLEQLDSLGIAHWEGEAALDFDDVYAQIEQLGAITGHGAASAELVAEMRADIAAVVDGLPELDVPLTYYHELDDTYFSVSSATFIGAVYDEIGLRNIVDVAEEDLGLYPQLSAEFIITANPDLIFLACTKYCGETAETVAARPGWDAIDAVRDGGVVEMDDDIASRWGPRIVEYLEVAGTAVEDAAARAGAG